MTKEEFKKIILEIIDTSDENSFNIFIEEIAKSIVGKEALKLNGIGYFQKRKEPLSRMERKGEGNIGEKEILLFLPENEIGEENILSFNINSDESKEEVFSDSVFDVGIDKPTIISDEDESLTDEDLNSSEIKLNTIHEFVASGEVLKNHELLGERAEENDLLEDDNEELEVNDELSNNENQDFTEAEINKEFMIDDSQTEAAEEEYEETSSSVEPEITEEDVLSSEQEIEEDFNDAKDESSEEEKTEESNPFDELENYIQEDTEDEAEEIINSEPEEELVENEPSVSEEIQEPKHATKKKEFASSNEWYKNPILYIASLSLIVAIAVVVIFWPSDENKVNENEINSELSSDTLSHGELTPAKVVKNGGDQKVEENSESKIESKHDSETVVEEKGNIEPKKVVEKSKSNTKSKIEKDKKFGEIYREIKNDQTITQRIYFDGKKYMVQASSWRSTSIAEREVNKLRKRGFDAFIYKVFIESKNGTWNRVRIGYFDTKTDAEEFLKKNKI